MITVDEEDEESEFVRVRKRHWARLSAKVWKENPEICPQCGSRLEVLSAFVARQLASQSSPAQDDVIERILRCRGEWPCGLRAVALRLRDQPSSATTLRAVPALSGRSPLARSRLTRRGSARAPAAWATKAARDVFRAGQWGSDLQSRGRKSRPAW